MNADPITSEWGPPFPSLAQLLPKTLFEEICREYGPPYARHLQAIEPEGRILYGAEIAGCEFPASCQSQVWLAATESLRWGDICVLPCSCEKAIWAVPLTCNERVIGALVVRGVRLDKETGGASLDQHILEACERLLAIAIRHHLTNPARLELNRQEADSERLRAEAIHEWKHRFVDDLRALYLREEPELLAAIRSGDRPSARGVINRILVAIYSFGGERLDLLKSYSLELVVMMGRAAVQGGAKPEMVFGLRYRSLSELDQITDIDRMGEWLTAMLEHLLDALGASSQIPNLVQLGRALAYMEEALSSNLSREEVARVAGMSSGHFTRLLRERTGHSFIEMLTLLRVNRARERLLHSHDDLAHIALDCGFADQSYFTRVFHKVTGQTPGDFRKGG